ncbi:MAG: hypothetical protein Q9O62_05755 [Ardenticatenia bacterium]|nr:hypothetical protein [Ardenticatenia bacterium]
MTRSIAWIGTWLGGGGWWLPWVLHPKGAAALVLLGLDLGEFFKFTTLWRNGTIGVERDVLYVPPVAASLLMSALAAHWPARARTAAGCIAGVLALVVLPEPERWRHLATPEFRAQGLLAGVGLAMFLLSVTVGPRLPAWTWRSVGGLAALAGALLPLWGFWRLELVLEWLYGSAILWGPGLWVTTLGFTGALIALTAEQIRARRS